MRQKYVISRDGPQKKLIIREYAIIETKVKKPVLSILQKGKFTLLCEESYENELIKSSIANGIKSLVAILRTHNFYPIQPYANRIAETVLELFDSSKIEPVELIFDDVDLVSLDAETI